MRADHRQGKGTHERAHPGEVLLPATDQPAEQVDVAAQHARVIGDVARGHRALADAGSAVEVEEGRHPHTTLSGSRRWPVGPTWISVPISGHTPQS